MLLQLKLFSVLTLALALPFGMRLIAYQLEQAQKVKPNEMIDS